MQVPQVGGRMLEVDQALGRRIVLFLCAGASSLLLSGQALRAFDRRNVGVGLVWSVAGCAAAIAVVLIGVPLARALRQATTETGD